MALPKQRAKALKSESTDLSWIVKSVDTLRDIVGDGVTITKSSASAALGLGESETEERLRKLTQLGWLHMSAVRSEDGVTFLHFKWELR